MAQRGDIRARFPEDIGRTLHWGGNLTMTVSETETCEDCGAEVKVGVVVQGETDSFGWEPVVLCKECHEKSADSQVSYYEALDVEDLTPKEGHVFMVSESSNDDSKSWLRTFDSLRAATKYYRKISDRADQYGGLYPDNGVREVSKEKADEYKAAERAEYRELMEELYGCEEEEEDDDYDDYDQDEDEESWEDNDDDCESD
jgi:hypothetical protein